MILFKLLLLYKLLVQQQLSKVLFTAHSSQRVSRFLLRVYWYYRLLEECASDSFYDPTKLSVLVSRINNILVWKIQWINYWKNSVWFLTKQSNIYKLLIGSEYYLPQNFYPIVIFSLVDVNIYKNNKITILINMIYC